MDDIILKNKKIGMLSLLRALSNVVIGYITAYLMIIFVIGAFFYHEIIEFPYDDFMFVPFLIMLFSILARSIFNKWIDKTYYINWEQWSINYAVLGLNLKKAESIIAILKEFKEEFSGDIKRILGLKEGWDTPKSSTYEKKTIILGLIYLSKLKLILKEVFEKDLPSPELFPGSSRGIEFEWGGEGEIDFQVSFPALSLNHLISIYGYDKNTEKELLIDCKMFEIDKKLTSWLNQALTRWCGCGDEILISGNLCETCLFLENENKKEMIKDGKKV